jgi:gamma-glutamyl-gamma-aminobutyrate hydrolase PuuD
MRIWGIIIAILLLWGCQTTDKRLILVSKDNHSNIEKWLHKVDSTLDIRVFYTISRDSMDFYLSKADAIVLGGGEDVNPSMYGHKEYLTSCEKMDLFRDSIEQVLINYAFAHRLPLLGICRGEQILNASTGGTLIPDIPTYRPSTIKHRNESDSAHIVLFTDKSWLKAVLCCDSICVNSHHHQSVDAVAPGFEVTAKSPDGIIESIRYSDTLKQPFIAGIQWHPEALLDEPSMKIARLFLSYGK